VSYKVSYVRHCRLDAVSPIPRCRRAEVRRESAAVADRSQLLPGHGISTSTRRRYNPNSNPNPVESARRRAVGRAHRWRADAGSDRRWVVDESRHRPANVGHGRRRRPITVVHRV